MTDSSTSRGAADEQFQAIAISSRLLEMECFIRRAVGLSGELQSAHRGVFDTLTHNDLQSVHQQLTAAMQTLQTCRRRFPLADPAVDL